jgi:hypothetical protein
MRRPRTGLAFAQVVSADDHRACTDDGTGFHGRSMGAAPAPFSLLPTLDERPNADSHAGGGQATAMRSATEIRVATTALTRDGTDAVGTLFESTEQQPGKRGECPRRLLAGQRISTWA